MTVKELYEWAVKNHVEDCTIVVRLDGSVCDDKYIIPEIETSPKYPTDGTVCKEVIL